MRTIIFLLLLISFVTAIAQKTEAPTSSFVISGEVKAPVTIGFAELGKLTVQNIGDVVITNHMGEKKSEAKGLKGVLLKDVLSAAVINAENPKVLSEYYFVCKANDGYTVVYSWNEIFNTKTGDSAYIITEKEGKPLAEMKDAILMLSRNDTATGRRHVKALMSIDIRKAR